ncbi:hypothetical protein D3C77_558860 [compost metagenome]
MTFSRTPPIGRTCPVKVSSPVIATPFFGAWSRARDSRALAMVTPALGPSLGVAPSGTCRWMKASLKYEGSPPYLIRLALT